MAVRSGGGFGSFGGADPGMFVRSGGGLAGFGFPIPCCCGAGGSAVELLASGTLSVSVSKSMTKGRGAGGPIAVEACTCGAVGPAFPDCSPFRGGSFEESVDVVVDCGCAVGGIVGSCTWYGSSLTGVNPGIGGAGGRTAVTDGSGGAAELVDCLGDGSGGAAELVDCLGAAVEVLRDPRLVGRSGT